MNLDSFEERIDPTILSRGRSSYRENSVISLVMTQPNHYKAKVAGTRLYVVTATLDDRREVGDISCTCPYDWGQYCKHEVAVMYALRHHLDNNKHTMAERPEEVDLAALLGKKSKKELLSFLLAYAKRSPELASALAVAFLSPAEEINQKNQGIQSSETGLEGQPDKSYLTNLGIEFSHACDNGIELMPNEDDYGWDEYEYEDEDVDEDWQFSSTFKKKIEELLGMARSAIQRGDIRHGGAIASMMVHELCSLDYDSEYLLSEIEEVIEQVGALFDDSTLDSDDASWLFAQFFPEVRDYNDVPQEALLSLCFQVAETEGDQGMLRNYLIDLASGETQTGGAANALIYASLELQYYLLVKQNRGDDAKAFALDHLSYEGMRLIAFESALEAKEYALAEKLAKEKEASAYRAFGSIDWSILLFTMYQKSGNKEQVRSLAREFLLHDKIAYYPILKESYDQKEWEAVVDGLLDELQGRDSAKRNTWNSDKVYPEVLKAEGKLERLLTYIKRQPYLVQTYQDVLLPHYREEVFALYRTIILAKGETVANRNEYQALASLLEEFALIGGEAVAKACVQELAPKYKNRPAMKDEIRKVGLL
ncbi:MAG: hypothetical protein RBR15_10245 [Sphaerochaeta sp.]|nr:hypothetical protein [Sphaerochaeta sp.]